MLRLNGPLNNAFWPYAVVDKAESAIYVSASAFSGPKGVSPRYLYLIYVVTSHVLFNLNLWLRFWDIENFTEDTQVLFM